MSLAVVQSRAKLGIEAPKISVEVHLSNGLPAFNIVGLPETSVKESKDRVRRAIINSHFEFPARRITVNLAPADIPKEGSRFDLAIAIAVAILAASKQIPMDHLDDFEFISELALSGDMRSIEALLPSAQCCSANGK
jgi:magnesium chelatase family protein